MKISELACMSARKPFRNTCEFRPRGCVTARANRCYAAKIEAKLSRLTANPLGALGGIHGWIVAQAAGCG
jgi:hypothetical protein